MAGQRAEGERALAALVAGPSCCCVLLGSRPWERLARYRVLRRRARSLPQGASASLCANWEVHRGINIVEGRVNPSCNLMGTQPPCGAGSSYPDPSYTDYLWLGEVDSLGECQFEALKQVDDECAEAAHLRCPCLPPHHAPTLASAPGLIDALALSLLVRSEHEYQPCVSVAYYTATSTEESFRKQCYCGTTKDWSAQVAPAVISARFDGATECWCAPTLEHKP
jgi:hypothetical protein